MPKSLQRHRRARGQQPTDGPQGRCCQDSEQDRTGPEHEYGRGEQMDQDIRPRQVRMPISVPLRTRDVSESHFSSRCFG